MKQRTAIVPRAVLAATFTSVVPCVTLAACFHANGVAYQCFDSDPGCQLGVADVGFRPDGLGESSPNDADANDAREASDTGVVDAPSNDGG